MTRDDGTDDVLDQVRKALEDLDLGSLGCGELA